MKNYGKLYKEHTAILKHREWRGFKDTMYDYYRWLITWKDMIKMVLKAPISTVKGNLNKKADLGLANWLFYILIISLKKHNDRSCYDTADRHKREHARQDLYE